MTSLQELPENQTTLSATVSCQDVPFPENAGVLGLKKRGRPKGSKNKRGRPKGSNKLKRTNVERVVAMMDESGQRLLVKKMKRMGRPKGSKNKRRKLGENEVLPSGVGLLNACTQLRINKRNIGQSTEATAERIMITRGRGRPKGLKNKKKTAERIKTKRVPGRPKVLKNKKKTVTSDEMEVVLPIGDTCVGKRPADGPVKKEWSKTDTVSAGDFGVKTDIVAAGNFGASENQVAEHDGIVKKKIGRPKASKNTRGGPKGSKNKRVRPKILKNKMRTITGDEMEVVLQIGDTCVGMRHTDAIIQNECSKTDTVAADDCGVKMDIVAAGDFGASENQVAGYNNIVKKKIGRPKGSKNKKKIGLPKASKNKKRIGRPKGSMNKKKILIGSLAVACQSGALGKDIDTDEGNSFISGENAGELSKCLVGYKQHTGKPRCRPRASKTNVINGLKVDAMCQDENGKTIAMAGQSGVILNEEEGMIDKKKDRHGQPKGSRTKNKLLRGHSSGTNTNNGDGDRILKKERRGWPKGPKTKKKTTDGDYIHANLCNRGQDVGTRRTNVVQKKVLLFEEKREVVLDSVVRPVRRKGVPGRPKGSKNKKKTIESFSRDVGSGNGGGAMNISKDHENKLTSLATGLMVGIPEVSTSGKDTFSLSRGLHNENNNFESEKNQHTFVDAAEEGGIRRQKDRRGRPKGSKNKNKLVFDAAEYRGVTGEIVTDRYGVNLSMKRKSGRGRPKGSKNKKTKFKSVDNNKTAGALLMYDERGDSCGMLPVATVNGGISGEPIVLDVEEGGVIKRKVGRGRPKGSKNKKKAVTFNLGLPCQVSCQNAISRMFTQKHGRGRPKGLNNNNKIAIIPENGATLGNIASGGEDEHGTEEDWHGPPKGSKKRKRLSAGEDCRVTRKLTPSGVLLERSADFLSSVQT